VSGQKRNRARTKLRPVNGSTANDAFDYRHVLQTTEAIASQAVELATPRAWEGSLEIEHYESQEGPVDDAQAGVRRRPVRENERGAPARTGGFLARDALRASHANRERPRSDVSSSRPTRNGAARLSRTASPRHGPRSQARLCIIRTAEGASTKTRRVADLVFADRPRTQEDLNDLLRIGTMTSPSRYIGARCKDVIR
jgi:hypothetical protein